MSSEAIEVSVSGNVAPEATPNKQQIVQVRKRFSWTPYILILPAILIVLLALGYPLIWQLMTSMQKFGLAQQFGTAAPEWVWFDNYITLFSDSYMWKVVFRSIAFCFTAAITTMAIGLLMALLMKAVHGGVRITLQIALLLAWAMPVVAAMTIWSWLFDWRRGLVNHVLTNIGINMNGYNWLAQPLTFYLVAVIIVV